MKPIYWNCKSLLIVYLKTENRVYHLLTVKCRQKLHMLRKNLLRRNRSCNYKKDISLKMNLGIMKKSILVEKVNTFFMNS